MYIVLTCLTLAKLLLKILFLLLGLGGIQAAAFSNKSSLAAAAGGNAGASDGAQSVNQVASIEQLLYISVSMGLSLLVSVWFFFR
jgi:aquaporin related protein